MMNDHDGAQKNEVVWMLEKLRRAAHLIYIYQGKRKDQGIENEVDEAFDYMLSIVKSSSGSNAVKRAGAELAIEELRRMAKRKTAQ